MPTAYTILLSEVNETFDPRADPGATQGVTTMTNYTDTSAAYDSIADLDGLAYDFAKHLVDGVVNNEEFNGPGTFPSWETTPEGFNLIYEIYVTSWDEDDGDLEDLTAGDMFAIRCAVTNAVHELQVEYALGDKDMEDLEELDDAA